MDNKAEGSSSKKAQPVKNTPVPGGAKGAVPAKPTPRPTARRRTGVVPARASDIPAIPGPGQAARSPAGSGKRTSPVAPGKTPSPVAAKKTPAPIAAARTPSPVARTPSPAASSRRRTSRVIRREPEVDPALVASVKQELRTGMGGEDDAADESDEREIEVQRPERSARRRRSVQAPNFKWRLLAGMLGEVGLLGVQAWLFWPDLLARWTAMLGTVERAPWIGYVLMGLVLFAGVFLVGLVAAIEDRSSVRAFQLGVALCAIGVVGATAYRMKNPPDAGAATSVPISVRMAQFALNPGLYSRADRVNDLEALNKKRDQDIKRLEQNLIDKDVESKEAQDAGRAELAKVTGALAAAKAKGKDALESAAAKGAELTAQRQQARAQLEKSRDQVQAAEQKANQFQARRDEALEKLNALEATLAQMEPVKTAPPAEAPEAEATTEKPE